MKNNYLLTINTIMTVGQWDSGQLEFIKRSFIIYTRKVKLTLHHGPRATYLILSGPDQ